MATVIHKSAGSFYARWYRRNGTLHEEATGIYEREAALLEANRREARERFWEENEAGVWAALAALDLSPRFCHKVFTHRAHITFSAFRALLQTAQIKFAAPGRWRDRVKRPAPTARRFAYRGAQRTVPEIVELSGSKVPASAVRWRLYKGWDLAKALRVPLMTRREVASLGARAANEKRRKER